MVFHASALSRSQCAKKSTKDVFNEDISEDLLVLFVIGTHMNHWMWVALTQSPHFRGLLTVF